MRAIAFALLGALSATGFAQTAASNPKQEMMPIKVCTIATPCVTPLLKIADTPPLPDDVASIDGMIKAWYDIVSGPKGQPRPWARDHSLYRPETLFLSVDEGKDGKMHPMLSDHTSYATAAKGLEERGFFEHEIHRVVQRFGTTAHVWSTYESRQQENGPIIARGINSIEMFWDGKRWWIMYAEWNEETKDVPIPKEYLP